MAKIVKTLKFPVGQGTQDYQINAVYLEGKSASSFAENKLATTGNNGLMSWEDKKKLENIPAEEEVWIFDCGTATINI